MRVDFEGAPRRARSPSGLRAPRRLALYLPDCAAPSGRRCLSWSHAGQGSIMDTSETLLTSVAIRLAVILVVGLIARNAAADLPRREDPLRLRAHHDRRRAGARGRKAGARPDHARHAAARLIRAHGARLRAVAMRHSGPTGKSLRLYRNSCQGRGGKIFNFRFSENYDHLPASRRRKRGVSRSSRTWAAGSDGRSGARGERVRCGRSSRVVPIPDAGIKPARDERVRQRWLKSPDTGESTEQPLKPLAQGMPVFRRYLSLLACATVHFRCTQGSRVQPASGIPCAL